MRKRTKIFASISVYLSAGCGGVLLLSPAVRAERQESSTKATATKADSGKSLDDPLDYSILYNRVFNYNDIIAAKTTNRLNDDGVAGVLKIAKASGLSFRYIVNRVGIGQNLPVVAEQLGFGPDFLKNVAKEKEEIAAYESAYLATGEVAQRRNTIEYLLAVAAKNKPKDNKVHKKSEQQ